MAERGHRGHRKLEAGGEGGGFAVVQVQNQARSGGGSRAVSSREPAFVHVRPSLPCCSVPLHAPPKRGMRSYAGTGHGDNASPGLLQLFTSRCVASALRSAFSSSGSGRGSSKHVCVLYVKGYESLPRLVLQCGRPPGFVRHISLRECMRGERWGVFPRRRRRDRRRDHTALVLLGGGGAASRRHPHWPPHHQHGWLPLWARAP
mmetsp:Transcript_16017/g.37311  ORF Transcript_16017/g.37311 Transcript_16017/m.37311 type:complete len:204 (-) Transcript_16017:275-886(-)